MIIKIKKIELAKSRKTIKILPLLLKQNYYISANNLSSDFTDCLLNVRWIEMEVDKDTLTFSANGWVKIGKIIKVENDFIALCNKDTSLPWLKSKSSTPSVGLEECDSSESLSFDDFNDEYAVKKKAKPKPDEKLIVLSISMSKYQIKNAILKFASENNFKLGKIKNKISTIDPKSKKPITLSTFAKRYVSFKK